jgi:hypothetical protein
MYAMLINFFSCNKHPESVYELLIYKTHENIGDTSYKVARHITLLAQENNVIRQQIFCDNSNHNYIVDSILILGFEKSKYLLYNTSIPIIRKKDFNYLQYENYEIDLTKEANTVFINNDFKNYSIDSIFGTNFLQHAVILIDPDYSLYISDSIYISHASRIIDMNEISFEELKGNTYIFIYDKNRQIIVSSELRDRYTHNVISKKSIERIIKITREDFDDIWGYAIWGDFESRSIINPYMYFY